MLSANCAPRGPDGLSWAALEPAGRAGVGRSGPSDGFKKRNQIIIVLI